MNSSEQAMRAFEEALRYLKFLERKNCATNDEVKELCSRANDFLVLFELWKTTAAVSANAYQLYMQTTPLWEILDLPQTKWPEWIGEYLSRKD